MITVRDQHKFKFVVPSQKYNILIINDLLVLSHEDGLSEKPFSGQEWTPNKLKSTLVLHTSQPVKVVVADRAR